MIGSGELAIGRPRRPYLRSIGRVAGWGTAAVVSGAAVAYLVASGFWYLALGFVVSVPALVVVLRYPHATILVWLVVTPLVSITDSSAVRQAFWVVHRGLPLVTLLLVVLGALARVNDRRMPRLGWPEVLMAAYVVAGFLSIAYTSDTALATAYLFYERVVIPMCLYLLVRLLQPEEDTLRVLYPVVLAILLIQSLVGILSWIAPGLVPPIWLAHAGQRTNGTFRDPDVFGTMVLLCGLVLLHGGLSSARRWGRVLGMMAFSWALLMAFMTFSRGNWFAGLVVLAGTLVVYRQYARVVAGFLVVVLLVLLGSGVLTKQAQFAQERLTSQQAEESALVRLPVALAALRMLEEKPLAGWGYGNFDRYSRPFQGRVADLVSPEKPHASHNFFLTILAEQGLVGFALFVGPMFLWLRRTRANLSNLLPSERRLVLSLWLGVSAYVIVNNFSVMKTPFGLGCWWLTLGLIATLVHRAGLPSSREREPA